MARKAIDMAGQRYGRLVVINPAPSKNHQAMWNCICDCGNTCIASGSSMRRGQTVSCGCVYRETRTSVAHKSIAKIKHGGSFERLYFVWLSMKARCYYSKDISYKNYGARGIKVCDEWKNDYAAFRSWALSTGYQQNAAANQCTLDRIDINGNYEPSNCRWVNEREQCQNKRSTIWITAYGITATPSRWAEMIGLRRATIYDRYKRGWSGEDIISPVEQHKRRIKRLA